MKQADSKDSSLKTHRLGKTEPSRSGTATVRVTILDENDNSPVFGQTSYEQTIPEGMPPGQRVAQITASDRDTGPFGRVTYRLKCPDCLEVFTVDPLTGLIRLNQPLNYETRTRYDLLILATDGGDRAATAGLTVRVLDENDQVPCFLRGSYAARVPENTPAGTMLVQTVAVDEDSVDSEINYTLTAGNPDKIFRVNRLGQVYLNYPLDYEKMKVHNLTVKAFEQDFPEHFSMVEVLVDVEDVNDNAPQFSEFIKTAIRVPENVPAGAVVGK